MRWLAGGLAADGGLGWWQAGDRAGGYRVGVDLAHLHQHPQNPLDHTHPGPSAKSWPACATPTSCPCWARAWPPRPCAWLKNWSLAEPWRTAYGGAGGGPGDRCHMPRWEGLGWGDGWRGRVGVWAGFAHTPPAVTACARRAQIPPHTPPTPPPPPNKPSNLAQLLRVGADVADAMAYLHTGTGGPAVVHRDLKPSNVLLDRDDRAKARPRLGPGWGCGWWKAGGGGRAAATRATAHSRLACPKTQPQNPCSLKGMRLWHCPRHEPHPSVHRGRGRHAQCEWVGGGLGQVGKGQAPSPARPFPPPNSLQTPSVHGPRDVRGWPPDPGR